MELFPYGEYFGVGPESIFQMAKALEAGYGTDVSQLTGGSALRVQALDNVLYDVLWAEDHIKLFKLLKKGPTHSTVDEWVRREEYGNPFGAAAPESANPVATTAQYERVVGFVKFYRTYREVSHVETVVRNIVQAVAAEEAAGARFLAGVIERDMFWGDSSVIPEQFDGLLAVALAQGAPECIIDLQGQPLNDRAVIHQAAAAIASNAGVPTHLFVDPLAKQDLDVSMLSAERFVVPTRGQGGLVEVDLGIGAVNTSWGRIEIIPDIFLAPERGWFNRKGDPLYKAPTVARGGDDNNPPPSQPTSVTAAAEDNAASKLPAGTYYYRVTSVNRNGESASVATDAVAVSSGQQVRLTISFNDANITGFRIYRSAKNASDASDCRFLYHVAKPESGNSVEFVDDGSWIPGCTCAFMVDLHPADPAVDWRQLLPMMRLDLAIVKPAIPWLQMIYGYLRVTRPWRIAVIKNILPTGLQEQGWQPV